MTRFIFITGGVVSSLGKGITAASIGTVLQHHGYKVRLRKLDPYLNVDPGTMSPFQHGEVFVTEDGTETDLDLGYYERFTGVCANRDDSVTSGRLYAKVIEQERRGDYLGATVQVIPHVTDEIKQFILKDSESIDFMICEIGGTIGDIESLPFIEAIRQLGHQVGSERVLYAHLTYVPYLDAAGEIKTKPTQHSVKELLGFGIQPDVLFCRANDPLTDEARRKIGLFCNLKTEQVISAPNMDHIYAVPAQYQDQKVDDLILAHFNLPPNPQPKAPWWETIVSQLRDTNKPSVRIGIIGKYSTLPDAYKSLLEAIRDGGLANNCDVKLSWITDDNSHSLTADLSNLDGILVPGGFGQRGTETKIKAITYARENNIPFFGICLGMQLACIEFARSVLKLPDANSREFGHCDDPVIDWLANHHDSEGYLGGTLRLGSYGCDISPDTQLSTLYESTHIKERHRHRYGLNPAYIPAFEDEGLIISAYGEEKDIPEAIELKNHPFFVAVQFHPEFKTRPWGPHPLFSAFIKAALIK
jgi:CTP synthase